MVMLDIDPINIRILCSNTDILPKKSKLSYSKIKSLYRGVGTVISIAIPARIIYITILEKSKEDLSNHFSQNNDNDCNYDNDNPSVAALSGGIAGGIAGLFSQILIVPMDVISQRQIVSNNNDTAMQTYNKLVKSDGYGSTWKGLYRGFGISIMSSIPGGASWWATYTACQEKLHEYNHPMFSGMDDEGPFGELNALGRQIVMQIISGSTQPLDVIKTRLQVGIETSTSTLTSKNTSKGLDIITKQSIASVARELVRSEGLRGLYRGILPRIINIGIWGTVFSSAYELLKIVSVKD